MVKRYINDEGVCGRQRRTASVVVEPLQRGTSVHQEGALPYMAEAFSPKQRPSSECWEDGGRRWTLN